MTTITPLPRMRSKRELIAAADQILNSTNSQTFDRAAQGKVENLLRAAELVDAPEIQRRDIFGLPHSLDLSFRGAQQEHFARTMDAATIAFFQGKRSCGTQEARTISTDLGRIEERSGVVYRGKRVGAISELRDFGHMLGAERRTYSGLTTAQGGTDGGNVVPIGFILTVFAAMKKTDGVLEAANWDTAATADGRPTNVPTLTDIATSAVKVAEAAPQVFQNPTFGNTSFPEATTWSSQMVITSVQLDEDAGVPLASLLADAFKIRFARGFGADCVATILADAPVGATTVGASAVTQADLLALVDSLDAEYAASDSAGWAMSWDTLLSIFTNVVTTASGGDALYRARRDAQGHYLLLGLPVFISNTLADIGAGNKSILFGDWSRFLIRNVPTMAIVWRFDELFMKNYQLGWEMTIRADSKIVHAGGAGDDPIKVLQCHS